MDLLATPVGIYTRLYYTNSHANASFVMQSPDWVKDLHSVKLDEIASALP